LIVSRAVVCMSGLPSVVDPTAGFEPAQGLMTLVKSKPLVVAQLVTVFVSAAVPDFSSQRKKGHQVGYNPFGFIEL